MTNSAAASTNFFSDKDMEVIVVETAAYRTAPFLTSFRAGSSMPLRAIESSCAWRAYRIPLRVPVGN